MFLPNRNINAIFNVILHFVCRYAYVYEQLKINKRKMPASDCYYSDYKDNETLRSNRLLRN